MTEVVLPGLGAVDLFHRHSETAETAETREVEVGVVPTTEEDL